MIRPDKLPRKIAAAPIGPRKCTCGCGGPRTALGVQNTRVVVSGCEASVRRWIRNPADWPLGIIGATIKLRSVSKTEMRAV